MSETEKSTNIKTIQSVERAIEILELLCNSNTEMKLTDIAKKLELNKTTVFHLIKTLELHGLVRQDPGSQSYSAGLKVLKLGTMVSENISLRRIAFPYMRELNGKYNETVHLTELTSDSNGYEGICVDKIDSTQSLMISSKVGRSFPLYCTASGKLFLSGFSDDKLVYYKKSCPLIKHTHNTITSWDKINEELDLIRKNKCSYDDEEFDLGVFCIAAPIYDYNKEIAAVLSISIPLTRKTDDYIKKIARDLKDSTGRISLNSGYHE
ncbi:MAG: IclR family transcriptional regulator [Clostridiaceae bacterium]